MFKVNQCLMNAEESPGLLDCTEKMKGQGKILYLPDLTPSQQCRGCPDCEYLNKDIISGVCPPGKWEFKYDL